MVGDCHMTSDLRALRSKGHVITTLLIYYISCFSKTTLFFKYILQILFIFEMFQYFIRYKHFFIY